MPVKFDNCTAGLRTNGRVIVPIKLTKVSDSAFISK
jgi:hypothetical protein